MVKAVSEENESEKHDSRKAAKTESETKKSGIPTIAIIGGVLLVGLLLGALFLRGPPATTGNVVAPTYNPPTPQCRQVPYDGQDCNMVPYTDQEAYQEQQCQNVPYTDRECENKELTFSFDRFYTNHKCLQTQEKCIHWNFLGMCDQYEDECVSAAQTCSFVVRNLDAEPGTWAYEIKFTTPYGDRPAGRKSEYIYPQTEKTFYWEYQKVVPTEQVSCGITYSDIPKKQVCRDVIKTRQDCSYVTKYRPVTKERQECKTVTKYREECS